MEDEQYKQMMEEFGDWLWQQGINRFEDEHPMDVLDEPMLSPNQREYIYNFCEEWGILR